VAYLSNKSCRCDACVKSNILQKRCYATQNFKSFLDISNTNAVIPPKFYKIKIKIIYTVPLAYFQNIKYTIYINGAIMLIW
jgi:hypothetical protein